MFSREKRLQKLLKEAQTNNSRAQREFQRDQRQLQRNEAELKAEIKRLAAQGDEKSCAMLAKQLVTNRKHVARTAEMSARMNGVTAQQRMYASNMRMANAAKTGTSIMTKMNKVYTYASLFEVVELYSILMFFVGDGKNCWH